MVKNTKREGLTGYIVLSIVLSTISIVLYMIIYTLIENEFIQTLIKFVPDFFLAFSLMLSAKLIIKANVSTIKKVSPTFLAISSMIATVRLICGLFSFF